MTQSPTQLSALSRLFSSSVFHELAKKGRSPLFCRLFKETILSDRFHHKNNDDIVSKVFDDAFKELQHFGYRDEYVFRAALIHNKFLGHHNLREASILTEFRAGACKADLAILNGTSTVYEIKSDRDSLARLTNQIENYRKVFAQIYVIASEKYVDEILNTTSREIGVLILNRKNGIKTKRKAIDCSDLVCTETIFESLRMSEAQAILKDLNIPIPDIPNTMQHAALREIFSRLNPKRVHDRMVITLKKTRTLEPLENLVFHLPNSLKPAAISFQVRRSDHNRLIKAITTPMREAVDWGRSL
jgi:hypothetical protein